MISAFSKVTRVFCRLQTDSSSTGKEASVSAAMERLQNVLVTANVFHVNTVLPTLLNGISKSSAARRAIANGALQLVDTALQIEIPEAKRPKALLGGADRLATIIHLDGSIEVSFGQMRESNEESRAFSHVQICYR